MTQPIDLGPYMHIKRVLDAALTAGGARYTLKNKAEAITWRAKAYKFRKLFRETLALGQPPNAIVETVYDPLVLKLTKGEPEIVLITLPEEGRLEGFDGQILTPYRQPIFESHTVTRVGEEEEGNELDLTGLKLNLGRKDMT